MRLLNNQFALAQAQIAEDLGVYYGRVRDARSAIEIVAHQRGCRWAGIDVYRFRLIEWLPQLLHEVRRARRAGEISRLAYSAMRASIRAALRIIESPAVSGDPTHECGDAA